MSRWPYANPQCEGKDNFNFWVVATNPVVYVICTVFMESTFFHQIDSNKLSNINGKDMCN